MAFRQGLATLLLVSFLLGLLSSFGEGHLSLNYYSKSCPRAEDVVKEEVAKLYHKHHDTGISWARNLFHECMVTVRNLFPVAISSQVAEESYNS